MRRVSHTLSLARGDRPVLGAILNRSESVGGRRDSTGRVGHAPFRAVAIPRRRRLRARKGRQPPPVIAPLGRRTTFHRAAPGCRAPLVPQRWLAVTHNRLPVAFEWRGQGRGSGCALARPRRTPPPGRNSTGSSTESTPVKGRPECGQFTAWLAMSLAGRLGQRGNL